MVDAFYIKGSVIRHLFITSFTTMIGALSVRLNVVVDIYFLSLLHVDAIMSSVLYTAIFIDLLDGFSVGCRTASSSRIGIFVGADSVKLGRILFMNSLIFIILFSITITIIAIFVFPHIFLKLYNPSIEVETYAKEYAMILIFGFPIRMITFFLNGVLRVIGDVRSAVMSVVLSNILNFVLDPLFIFYFDWGVEGAAYASVAARVVQLFILSRRLYFYNMFIWLRKRYIFVGIRYMIAKGSPAIIAELLRGLGVSIFVWFISSVGDEGLTAGFSVFSRFSQLLFIFVFVIPFSLSPIISQNLGAGLIERIRSVTIFAILLSTAGVVLITLGLKLYSEHFILLFNLNALGKSLFLLYVNVLSYGNIFVVIILVTTSLFNSTGFTIIAMWINFLRSSLFLIPFVWLGKEYWGWKGIFFMYYAGLGACALFSLIVGYLFLKKLQNRKHSVSVR